MIFTERTITVVNDSATINKPLILYRGDKNIELKITIAESQFKFRNNDASNVIETTDASYAQLVINTPYNSPIFSDVAVTKNGAVIFVITEAMIDEIREVGAYEIQIRLLDDNKQSRASIPPVSNAIEIREPIAIEDGSAVDSNAVNVAKVNRALTTTSAPLEAFDSQGNYIKKTWGDGDPITDAALNKMEAGIDGVNKKIANVNNINDTTASATTTYSSNKIETIKGNISSHIDKINTIIQPLNESYTYKEISIDVGTATTPRDAISIFTGWALPFKKADLKGDITYVSAYVVAYDNSTDKNLITNVPVNLELIQGGKIKVKSRSVLKESGKVEFKLSLPLDELDDVFYLGVRATIKCNLMFWKCKFNSEFTFGDYPVIFANNWSANVDRYLESNTIEYGKTDFKIGTGTSFSNHKHKAEDIEGLPANKVKLSLPDKYELVVGDTFELFYKGILLCNNPYNYNFKITCNKGACYSKRYIFTPNSSDIGTHRLEIEVYDDNENLLDSKVVRLIVKNKPSSPSSVQNILCVGDSLSNNGAWPSEVCRRLTGTAGSPIADGLSNINFIGTCKGFHGGKYEGYGGWTYANYNTNNIADQQYWINTTANKNNSYQKSVWKDSNNIQWVLETLEETRIKVYRNNYGTQMLPSSGALTWVSGGDGSDNSAISYTSYIAESGNPFWDNDTNRVDFSRYASKLGVSSIDHCYVLLGWNQTYDTETAFKDGVRIFINNLLASFPTCKITLLGLQVPSLDGFGTNYGCSWNYYYKLKVVFNMNKWNYELAQEFANVDFINIAGQFDSENNILTSTRRVNVRNSKTEVYGSNGIHPAYEGYMQIADAVYRNLSHKL